MEVSNNAQYDFLDYLKKRQFSEEDHALSKLVHDFALKIIEVYKPEHVEKMVKSRKLPNLRIYKKLVPLGLRKIIYLQWVKNKEKIDQFFTYEELLFQCHDHRKDLFIVVSKPESKQWFTGLIDFVKLVITEDFKNYI